MNNDVAAACCIQDEGRPLGAAFQEEAPNHPKLLRLRAVVVSVGEKAGSTCQVWTTETNESEPLMRHRKVISDVETVAASRAQGEPSECLMIGWAASGV
ncbi:hypothetical protein LRD18_10170 [Halorhodospira halochloris]|uniref:hypothetical protein n=1 Tax=Halorhodospira halochloris TaxID=1052 RepID=UPI001EE8A996|nr:hypothetical protein [Halorhodospira halochloris]MCG5531226.1 hypothetical protein [Halorhodospira halochloris]